MKTVRSDDSSSNEDRYIQNEEVELHTVDKVVDKVV